MTQETIPVIETMEILQNYKSIEDIRKRSRNAIVDFLYFRFFRTNTAAVSEYSVANSLSKCYPGSINRFSEDIDLTFIPVEDMTNKKYSKALKRVEDTISAGFLMEKIEAERNDRNKSAFVWPENESKETCRENWRLVPV